MCSLVALLRALCVYNGVLLVRSAAVEILWSAMSELLFVLCVYILFALLPTTDDRNATTNSIFRWLYTRHTVWSHHIIETARATRYVYYSNLIAEEMRVFSVCFSTVQ